jgi:L-lactate dehydrogenase complex protein LldG
VPDWLHHPETPGPIFPLPGPAAEACRERFRQEFTAIHGEFHEADSHEAGQRWLAQWIAKENLSSPYLAAGNASLERFLAPIPGVTFITPDGPANERAQASLGITQCESLVAESGTIAVSAGLTGRAGTILPPIHLVIATHDQVVPDLDTSFARLRQRYAEQLPSTMSWITGPSRTGDIEKILVLGAHGPKRLVLLLLPTNSLP